MRLLQILLVCLFFQALGLAQGLRYKNQCTAEQAPTEGFKKLIEASCEGEILVDAKHFLQKGPKTSALTRYNAKGELESILINHEAKTWQQTMSPEAALGGMLSKLNEEDSKEFQRMNRLFEWRSELIFPKEEREILGQKARGMVLKMSMSARKDLLEGGDPREAALARMVGEMRVELETWTSETVRSPFQETAKVPGVGAAANPMDQLFGMLAGVFGGSAEEMQRTLKASADRLGDGLTLETVIRVVGPEMPTPLDPAGKNGLGLVIRIAVTDLQVGPIPASEFAVPADYFRFQ
jgi:hypothetical protein